MPTCSIRICSPSSKGEATRVRAGRDGVSNKEIASRLFVSEGTIKFHLKHIYSKLGVASWVQEVASARELGLVNLAGSLRVGRVTNSWLLICVPWG